MGRRKADLAPRLRFLGHFAPFPLPSRNAGSSLLDHSGAVDPLHSLLLSHLSIFVADRSFLQTRKAVQIEIRQGLGQVLRKSSLSAHPLCVLRKKKTCPCLARFTIC